MRKGYFLILFFCFSSYIVFGQNQKLADSLIEQYRSGSYQRDEMLLIRDIANEETNPDRKLHFSELLIKKSSSDSLFDFLLSGYLQKGNALQLKGNYILALEAYFESIKYARRTGDQGRVGAVTIAIAGTYSESGNSYNAEKYYIKGIQLLRKSNDSLSLATALLSLGDDNFNNKKYDSALRHFEESRIIFKNVNLLIGTAYVLGNIGMVYAEQGKDVLAEENINQAITILEELKDYYPISVYLTYMSDIYLNQNDWAAALSYTKRSLELAQRYGLKEQISDANLQLSELYEQVGKWEESAKYYKDHTTYKDSINNIKTVEKMADLRTDYEVSQKQKEVDLLEKDSEIQLLKSKRQKTIIYASTISFLLILILAIVLYRRYNFTKETNIIIEKEKDRSDNLLLNILPEETAQELKQSGKVQAKKFESVTVLFTDFIGFTHYAENLLPEKLVDSVDFYFSKFDEIIEKYDLEKIKTIGDAYMCAGGLHFLANDHAFKMVLAAFEIVEFVNEAKKFNTLDQTRFDIRVGINTGPVVAGVVGTKKFAYDIWGDTVNIASRMESNSETGKINVSQKTYELIKSTFDCEYRGEINVKNRGKMKMYFVTGIKDGDLSKLPE